MTPTTHRTVRVPDSIWDPARQRAAQEGVTMTDVIRQALVAYVFEHGKDADRD